MLCPLYVAGVLAGFSLCSPHHKPAHDLAQRPPVAEMVPFNHISQDPLYNCENLRQSFPQCEAGN